MYLMIYNLKKLGKEVEAIGPTKEKTDLFQFSMNQLSKIQERRGNFQTAR